MWNNLKCTFRFHDFKTVWFGWEPFKPKPLTIRFCTRCKRIESEYHDLFGPHRPAHYNWDNAVGLLGIDPHNHYMNIPYTKWSREKIVYPKIYESRN